MPIDLENIYSLYSPVAELNINVIALIVIGMVVGVLAGMCGIGGSIILLPILLFLNVPIHIAVTTALNQVLATSFSASIIYAKKKIIDYKFSSYLLVGSVLGLASGLSLYRWCSSTGKLDLFIAFGFLITLILVGTFNTKEVLLLFYYRYKKTSAPSQQLPAWVMKIPFYKTKFVSTKSSISVIFPILLGMLSSAMMSFMGLGGGLVMTPIMIGMMGISSNYIPGTISFQMAFTTLIAYYIHALGSKSIDLVLAIPLLIGTAFGAQFGAKVGAKLNQETFKIIIATVTLLLCAKIGFDFFAEPENIYQIEIMR